MFFNKQKIHFNGTKESNKLLKNQSHIVLKKRFYMIIIFVITVSLLFSIRLYYFQILSKDFYDIKLEQYSTNTFNIDGLRGEIVDRNYKKLVYNKNVICASYYAVKGIKKEEIDSMVKFLVDHIDINIKSVTLREKKDYLIMKDKEFTDSLISEEEKNQLMTDEDYDTKYYNLQLKRITDKVLKKHLTNDDIKYYKLYYTIYSTKSGSSVLLEDISVKEASIIAENSDLLKGIHVTNDWSREYQGKTLKQTLGKVTTKKQGIPQSLKDQLLALDYPNNARVGISGLELQYEDILKGEPSTYSLTYDDNGDPQTELVSEGTRGANLQLTLDVDLQNKINKKIDSELLKHKNEGYNNHIYVIVENPKTGEIIAMCGREYNRKTKKINDYAAGNYLASYKIGSTMKAAVLYTCFKNKVIKANHYEVDDAKGLKIAGTKLKRSWNKKGWGNINEVQALAYSSNIYMMKIIIKLAGGKYQYDKPLKINKEAFTTLRNGAGELGLGVKTNLDVPGEELGYRGSDANAGNLLDFSIGQYDTYTNMQLATYLCTLANMGQKVQPHLLKGTYTYDEEGNMIQLSQYDTKIVDDLTKYKTTFKQIRKGMKAVVEYGTAAKNFKGFKYSVAGKSGTAEDYSHTGNKDYPNHLFIAYSSADNPQVAVSVLVERQKNNNSAPKLAKYAFNEYFKKYGYKKK